MSSRPHILSTAMLDKALIYKAGSAGIAVDCLPFITIEPIVDMRLEAEVAKLSRSAATVVFTSGNAVRSVMRMLGTGKPSWDIYCIGQATKKEVLAGFGSATVKGVANDSAGLAPVMVKDAVREVTFFCGDKRLDTLPFLLRENNIPVNEIIVYRTQETPREIKGRYDGVLFFSPSGVRSFLDANRIDSSAVLFAIGNTTAKALEECADNKLIISKIPSKEGVIEEVTNYFQQSVPSLQGQ